MTARLIAILALVAFVGCKQLQPAVLNGGETWCTYDRPPRCLAIYDPNHLIGEYARLVITGSGYGDYLNPVREEDNPRVEWVIDGHPNPMEREVIEQKGRKVAVMSLRPHSSGCFTLETNERVEVDIETLASMGNKCIVFIPKVPG